MLALCCRGGRVMLVDEATGEVRWEVQAHAADSITKVAMSPNGRFVASVGSFEENWKLWDAASGAAWMAGARHDGTGACICAVDDLGHRSLQEGCPAVAHTARLFALAFAPCGHRLASGGDDSAVILWDAQTGEAEQRMGGDSEGRLMALAFSADGARLAIGGNGNGLIRVWDVTAGVLLRSLAHARPRSVHFSPTNNRTLASAGLDGLTRLWDVDSGEMMRSFEGTSFAVFSPDGRTIATASTSTVGEVLLVDVVTGALRLRLVGHESFVSSASFSVDDGSKLASGSHDGTCKVWDSLTGELLRTIEVGAPGLRVSVSWGRDWVRDTQRGVAFAMGHHPRLGERSQVQGLDPGVVRMILDRV